MVNKKTNQIATLALAVIMTAGSVGGAVYAEGPALINQDVETKIKDINAEEYQEAVIQKLVDKGYVAGYSDGSLGVENLITRAEFAAIATRGLGFEDLAETLKGTPTGFPDVDVADWHNGYIGVARTKNVVTGYPDKTFKPQGQITYGEALTMLVRMVIGPEEDAAVRGMGNWPTNYFVKATELGLLEDINGLDAREEAVRGKVFLVLNNVIEVLEDKNTTRVEALVLANDKDTLDLVILEAREGFKKGDVLNIPKTEETLNKLSIGSIYTVRVNADKKITAIDASLKSKTVNGKVSKTRRDFEVDGKTYNTDSLLKLKHNNKEVEYKLFPNDVEFSTATIFDGKLIYLDAHSFDEIMPIDEVKNNRVYGITKSGEAQILNLDRYTNISLLDGTEVKAEDIEAGDIAHIRRNRRDIDVIISKNTVKGKVSEINNKNKSIVIEEKEYKIEENSFPTMLTQGRRFLPIVNVNRLSSLKDSEVELSINLNGKVQLIRTEQNISLRNKAIVESIEKDKLNVITQDGYRDVLYVTNYTDHLRDNRYNDRDDRDDRYDKHVVERIMAEIKVGDMVNVLVDGRGDIEEIEILKAKEGIISYIDFDIVEIDGREEFLVEDYALFSVLDGKYEVASKADFEDIFYKNKDAKVEALIFEDYREVEAIVIGRTAEEKVDHELVKFVKDNNGALEIANKYKANKKVETAITNITKTIDEINANIEKMDEKDVEKYRTQFTTALERLNKEVLAEILAQVSVKIEEVEKTNKIYNEESFETIKAYYTKTKALVKIEDYSKIIKEAEEVLKTFETKVYEDITVLEKELNELEKSLEVELKEAARILSRVVYNDELVDEYKLFLDRLKNETKNMKDIEVVQMWQTELTKNKTAFDNNKLNVASKHENLVSVFLLEERLEVASGILEMASSSRFDEKTILSGEVTKATRFITSVKNIKDAGRIDMEKLEQVDTDLRKAVIDLAVKINVSLTEDAELEALVAKADVAKNNLIAEGKTDLALELNELVFELKAYVVSGRAEKSTVERIEAQIELFLVTDHEEEETPPVIEEDEDEEETPPVVEEDEDEEETPPVIEEDEDEEETPPVVEEDEDEEEEEETPPVV